MWLDGAKNSVEILAFWALRTRGSYLYFDHESCAENNKNKNCRNLEKNGF
jgi:hypothetical protein